MRYEIPAPDAILPACRVLPVIVVRETTEVNGILSALLDGGVGCVEITFRTDCAADAIRHATEQFPGVCVGAGTVINAGQAEIALSCGAKFIVSPGVRDADRDHACDRLRHHNRQVFSC